MRLFGQNIYKYAWIFYDYFQYYKHTDILILLNSTSDYWGF